MSERISASRTIPAPPEEVFAVLTDPDGHVAIDSSGMLQSATGAVVTGAGDTFVVHMDREALGDLPMGRYDVEVTITRLAEDDLIEWSTLGTIRPSIGHVFGYQLAPVDVDGTAATLATSYCDWSNAREEWKAIFPVIDEKALRASLGLLERAVLRGYPQAASD